jgi:hypothetical protein
MGSTVMKGVCELRIAVLALFSCVWTDTQAGENYVIIAVDPPSEGLDVGTLFMQSDNIVVPSGVKVTLLSEDGQTEKITGPGTYLVTQDEDATVSPAEKEKYLSKLALVASFLANERRRTDAMGGSRGRAQINDLQTAHPWAVSVDVSGKACIRDGRLTLIRETADRIETFSIRLNDQAWLNDLVWRLHERTFDLPIAVPTTARKMTIEADARSTTLELRIKFPAADTENPLDALGWMTAQGCGRQAMAFVQLLVNAK